MRNKLLFGLLALFAVAALFSFTDERVIAPTTYAPAVYTDTITNAGADTLTLPVFSNAYNLGLQLTNTQLSGTTNVSVYVEASILKTGSTNFVRIDTLTGTSAATRIYNLGTTVYSRYRFIRKGTGTQSTRTQYYFLGKPGFGATNFN